MKVKILLGMIFLCFVTSVVCSSDLRIKHIVETFQQHSKEFLERANSNDTGLPFMFLEDETNKGASYYLVMSQGSLSASKQIELKDEKVEIYNERVFVTYDGYLAYSLDHFIIDRNNALEKEELPKQEIWDEVINHFFKKQKHGSSPGFQAGSKFMVRKI